MWRGSSKTKGFNSDSRSSAAQNRKLCHSGLAMIDVAIIPARGGSVGLPGKNIIDLGGKPLIAWTIEAAQSSGMFARVIVSTDDESIAKAAQKAGADVPFMRPKELASSTSSSIDVVNHALNALNVDQNFALLQPTSPLRAGHHIREAAQLKQSKNAKTLVSVTSGKPLSWTFQLAPSGRLEPLLADATVANRRQDAPPIVVANGAIYIQDVSYFRKHQAFLTPDTIGYKMGQIQSIDIDDYEDLEIARAFVATDLHMSQS